jgi:glycerol-3-phosphate dehydrogenase
VIHVLQLPFSSLKSKLARKGNVMYDDICKDLGVELHRMPALLVVKGWSRVPILIFAYLYIRSNLRGQFRTQLMRGSNLRKLEPSLSSSITAGIVTQGYGTIDSESLITKLKQVLVKRGVPLEFGCEVKGVEFGENSTLLKTKSEISAKYVVNSAGLYSDDVARMLGKDLGKLEPGLGVMAVYSGFKLKTIIAPLPLEVGARTKGGAIIPATNGTTIFGPTLRVAESKEERAFTQEDVNLLQAKFFPLLSVKGEQLRVYTGVRPLSPTKDFIVDVDQKKRMVNLVGIESPGLTAAPAIAEIVEKAILGDSN